MISISRALHGEIAIKTAGVLTRTVSLPPDLLEAIGTLYWQIVWVDAIECLLIRPASKGDPGAKPFYSVREYIRAMIKEFIVRSGEADNWHYRTVQAGKDDTMRVYRIRIVYTVGAPEARLYMSNIYRNARNERDEQEETESE